MAAEPIFRIVFVNHGKVYELYARSVFQSDMYGFIEIEDFVFGERAQVIVDPEEEKLKTEFAGVKRTYVPMHNLIRIDEVEKEGSAKIREVKGSEKVTPFPIMGGQPPKPRGDD